MMILRGKPIEEFSTPELLKLHQQLRNAISRYANRPGDYPKLLELDLISEELRLRQEITDRHAP